MVNELYIEFDDDVVDIFIVISVILKLFVWKIMEER